MLSIAADVASETRRRQRMPRGRRWGIITRRPPTALQTGAPMARRAAGDEIEQALPCATAEGAASVADGGTAPADDLTPSDAAADGAQARADEAAAAETAAPHRVGRGGGRRRADTGGGEAATPT